ncbi:MAG: hypothetical protein AB7O66_22600 [Limisphaerales bacterium]
MDEIEFRETNGGRAAYLADWNVPVWRIVMGLEAARGDLRRTARRFCLPVGAVRSALHYAAAHSREIHIAMRERPGGSGGSGPRPRPAVTVADRLVARVEAKSS